MSVNGWLQVGHRGSRSVHSLQNTCPHGSMTTHTSFTSKQMLHALPLEEEGAGAAREGEIQTDDCKGRGIKKEGEDQTQMRNPRDRIHGNREGIQEHVLLRARKGNGKQGHENAGSTHQERRLKRCVGMPGELVWWRTVNRRSQSGGRGRGREEERVEEEDQEEGQAQLAMWGGPSTAGLTRTAWSKCFAQRPQGAGRRTRRKVSRRCSFPLSPGAAQA